MKHNHKTKEQLTIELAELRQQVAELEAPEPAPKYMEYELVERAKELRFLYDIASITGAPDITLYERFEEIANLLPRAWQYPEVTCARITINNSEFKTENYRQTDWKQTSDIIIHGARAGTVEVGYLEARPEKDEGPFLKEERLLIDAVAERLGIISEHRYVEDALQRYLLSNIVGVTTGDLAQMGATLATGGIQSQTGRRVLKMETVKAVLSAMVTAGMYEDSGLWWTEVGLPAKSGAILAVVPGWGAIAAYSPRLDEAGNSVRAGAAIRKFAEEWKLHSMERLIATH